MKAVIFAAGKGTRMLPLTEKVPKVLVEVRGKPFLYHLMKRMQDAGVTEFGIVVGYMKEMFPDFLKKYSFNAELIYQNEQKGTGNAAMLAKGFAGSENFILAYGDGLWSADDIKRIWHDDDFCYIGAASVSDPSKYGVLVTDGDSLVRIAEKPKEYAGDLVNTGLYKFTPEIFEALKQIKLSPRGEYELTDAVSELAKKGMVKIVKLSDLWNDFGCIEDIPKVEKVLEEHNE